MNRLLAKVAGIFSLRCFPILCGLGLLVSGWNVASGAGPAYWDYPEAIEFQDFELEGMAIDRYGRLTAGLAPVELLVGGPEIVWRIIADGKGGIFAATGHSGEIWHIPAKGEATLYTSLAEPEIFSLLIRGKQLFAGGGPDGHLYRITDQGETEIWADLAEGYIWSLAEGPEGQLYLAVGSPAAVYVLKDRLQAERLAVLPAANALDLVVDRDGTLLVSTQGPGLIMRLDPAQPDTPRVIYEAAQEEVRRLVAGPDTAWYALALSRLEEGTGESAGNGIENMDLTIRPGNHGNNAKEQKPERAALYRLAADGLTSKIWSGNTNLLAVAYSETWGWLAAGVLERKQAQAVLYVLDEPAGQRTIATWLAGDVLDLLVQQHPKGRESVAAGLAHAGKVIRLVDEPAEGATAIAPPLDGGQPIQWGRLRWEGTVPDNGQLHWSVRSGARSQPDETWSDWSQTWSEQDHSLELPPSRFLQWRVEFRGGHGSGSVTSVTVSGYEPNRPPRIYHFALEPEGEIMMGGLMSREDNITESFPSGLRAEYSITSKQQRKAGLFQAAPARPLRTFTWLASDPNTDRLIYRLDYQRLGEATWRSLGEETRESLRSWDTSTVPDGRYVVRLTASDRPDNPRNEALSSTHLSAPLQVDHSAPTLSKFKVVRTEVGLAVSFQAQDANGPLGEAWLELPDGSYERLDPMDGICDSQTERFATEIAFPAADQSAPPEPWRIRIEVADRYGNVVSEEGEVK